MSFIITLLLERKYSTDVVVLLSHIWTRNGENRDTEHDSERSDVDDIVMRLMKMRRKVDSRGKCMNYVTSDSIE